jgi:serine/threonine-protein phosphatase 2A regulatory subunit B''
MQRIIEMGKEELLAALLKHNSGISMSTLQDMEERQFQTEWDRLVSDGIVDAVRHPKDVTLLHVPSFFPHAFVGMEILEARSGLAYMSRKIFFDKRLQELQCLDDTMMNKLLELLTKYKEADESISYEAYRKLSRDLEEWSALERAATEGDSPVPDDERFAFRPPILDALFFVCNQRDDKGHAQVRDLFMSFLLYVTHFKTRAEMMQYDESNSGCLSETELEQYLTELIPNVDHLKDMPDQFTAFYLCACMRKLSWFLDPKCTGRFSIDKLMNSVLSWELIEVQVAYQDPPRNWFGAAFTRALYEKFLYLDQRRDGFLRREDMYRYKRGVPALTEDGLPTDESPITRLFIDRFFEISGTFKGELDYKKYIDFSVAVESLPLCPNPVFFWRIFDIFDQGYITPLVLNTFFREVHSKLAVNALNPPSIELVVGEVLDLLNGKDPCKITREEFVKSPHVGLVSAILIDCLAYWTHETREMQAHQQQQQ